jgi:hypothetical protein
MALFLRSTSYEFCPLSVSIYFRVRHKKCDETRPYCLRCTSTGRKCDGYQQPPKSSTSASSRSDGSASVVSPSSDDPSVQSTSLLLPSDPSSTLHVVELCTAADLRRRAPTNNWQLTDRERGYLDFFRIRTSTQCGGCFHDDFWCRLVLQLSSAEPAIRHATIALGAIHRNFESLAVNERLRNEAFPLQQCNKAIALLRKRLGNGSRQMETALVTCILLMSFAFLQGDTTTATSHYHSGISLLREWQQTSVLRSPWLYRSIEATLVKLFIRMELYLSAFASLDDDDPFVVVAVADDEPVLTDVESIHMEDQIDSLDQAGDHLFSLMGHTMQNEQRRIFSSTPVRWVRERVRADVSSKLHEWTRKLNTFLEQHALSLSPKHTRILLVLQLWSETIRIINMAHDRESEMQFDAFEQPFRRIVRLAEALLEPGGVRDSRTSSGSVTAAIPCFSVETGVIPPLFYCSYKCRNWSIRREALSLLRRSHRQEGIWQTSEAAAVLERVIAIESEGLSPGNTVPESSRILTAQVKVVPNKPKIRLRYCRYVDAAGTKQWETEWLCPV